MAKTVGALKRVGIGFSKAIFGKKAVLQVARLCSFSKKNHSKFYLFFVSGLLVGGLFAAPSVGWAQAQSQQATVVLQGALVYTQPDFDAPVMTELNMGAIYTISTKKRGPFYRIRLKPGQLGWISDVDIRPGIRKLPPAKKDAPAPAEGQELKPDESQATTYYASRYRGISLSMINYTEDTMGGEQSALLPFYGLQMTGYNTLFSGPIFIETNLLFHSGAPKYYGEKLGGSSSGAIFIGNFLLQTMLPKSSNFMWFYGFGPMVKYSHFTFDLPASLGAKSYSADDLNIGVLFNLGAAYRFKKLSIRGDLKYYWEESKYFGAGLSFGWQF